MFRSYDESWKDLKNSVLQTFRTHWLRISIVASLCFILIGTSIIWPSTLHFAAEFLGALVLFLLIEHGLDKLDSGISDPKRLPIDEIIDDIEKSESDLIIYDIFLATIALVGEDKKKLDRFDKFKKNCKEKLKKDPKFSIKILLLDPESDTHIAERANQLIKKNITAADLKSDIKSCHKKILNFREECISDEINKDKFQVQYYKQSPLFSMYYINKCMNISFYPNGEFSTESRQLFVPEYSELGGLVGKFFIDQFEAIWEKSDPARLDSIK